MVVVLLCSLPRKNFCHCHIIKKHFSKNQSACRLDVNCIDLNTRQWHFPIIRLMCITEFMLMLLENI